MYIQGFMTQQTIANVQKDVELSFCTFAATEQHNVALLRASWVMLAEVVAASPAELHKDLRGGGRDRDEVRRHVIEAERVCARKIWVRHNPFDMNDKSALKAMREETETCSSRGNQASMSLSPSLANGRY
jgi:hypothetical protein